MTVHADVETGAPLPPEELTRPPVRHVTPRQWVRENLFNTWYNAVLTIVFGAGILAGLALAIRFVFFTARWRIIRVGLTSLMTGLYPRTDLWRAWVALFLVVLAVGLAVGAARRTVALAEEASGRGAGAGERPALGEALRRLAPVLTFLAVVLAFSQSLTTGLYLAALLLGTYATYLLGRSLPRPLARLSVVYGLVGLAVALLVLLGPSTTVRDPAVAVWDGRQLDQIGGLTLTLLLAFAGIVLSFPLGVAAALGRRSSLPVIKAVSVAYIELIRGVPLITLLFMGQLMLGLFFPETVKPDSLIIRSTIMITLFTGAYVAEIVRGGLQGVPRGQYEAAMALGLSPAQQMRLVILPQALRNVIPALVGQFISLLKDTSLVAIIGLTDLLRVARFQLPAQGEFAGQGLFAETMLFAGFVYWVFSYTMSRESQRLERRLGVGER